MAATTQMQQPNLGGYAAYAFEHGFPTEDASRRAHDDADFERAVIAYRFWYPTVSCEGMLNGNRALGALDNQGLMIMSAGPRHVFFTPNSDTPYGAAVLDLKDGPWVVEVPPGAFIGLANDHHQGWILDMGLPGPAGNKGGKHLIVPPGYTDQLPQGYFSGTSTSNKVLVALRALPVGGDAKAAMDGLRTVKIYPLASAAKPKPIKVVDVTDKAVDGTCLRWEDNIQFWQKLHEIIDAEPLAPRFLPMYGELAALGIEKGKSFKPDARMKDVLEKAAKAGRDQMLIAAFASDRPDRFAWKDRKWEWAGLVPESAQFETESGVDLEARDRWFAQAIVTSPAMFRRSIGAGSLYWLGDRDATGAYLDGGKTYKLTVPLPVPGNLFWSVTVYDSATRSEVQTPQDKAALRSLFELKDIVGAKSVDLYFGPNAPAGHEGRWIQTIPDRGWFTYFRIYGPEGPAFDGSWKPGDFEEVTEPAMTAGEFPAADIARRVVERRAFEAAIWGMPIVNYDLMLQEMLGKTGGKVNQVIYWGRPLDSKNQTLTPNPDALYFMAFFNTKDGPIVFDLPPGDENGSFNGNIVTAWQMPLEDAGLLGLDKGKGGKYLVLPPDYEGDPPAGYIALHSDTFGGYMLFRANFESHADADVAKAVAYGKRMKVYPLAQAGNSPATVFTDAKDVLFDSTIRYDATFFEHVHRVVQAEPWLDRDRAMIDSLKAIGIEKGKPFRPDDATKALLASAAREAGAWLEKKYDAGLTPFFSPNSRWTFPAPPEVIKAQQNAFSEPGEYPVDGRGIAYSYAYVGIKRLGVGQMYMISIRDKDGDAFDGAKTYRLAVPPNAPVQQYWSVTAYDRQTHALIRGMPRASRSSQIPELQKNADGSIDIYFGPKALAGKESNWVPTDPARKFELMFRAYAPTEALLKKTWVLPDVEKAT